MDRAKEFQTLLGLPEEIFIHILVGLDGRSLLIARATSRRFNDAVSAHKILQYIIELYSAGMIDGPPCSKLSTDDRLSRLQTYQRSWTTFSRVKEHNVPKYSGRLYELAGGVLGQSTDSKGPGNSRNGTLQFQKFPSYCRNSTSMERWSLTDFGHHITDFTVDPSQNLLVTMHIPITTVQTDHFVVELHLLSLTTGERHPLATKDYLEHTFGENPPGLLHLQNWTHTIQVCEDLVCIHHEYELEDFTMDTLAIWDWTAGEVIVKLSNCGITAFTFLTNNLILLAMEERLVREPHDGDTDYRLVVCDISETSLIQTTRRNCFADVCEFHFPPLNDFAQILSMDLRSDPYPSSFPNGNVLNKTRASTPNSVTQDTVPFLLESTNRLIIVTVSALADLDRRRGGRLVSFRFFVPLSTLLTHIHAKSVLNYHVIDIIMPDDSTQTLPDDQPGRDIAVPWSHWGPDGSRAFVYMSPELNENFVCYVYGSRFASRHPPVHTAATRVRILDFNRLSLRHCNTVDSEGESDELDTSPHSTEQKRGNHVLPAVAKSQTFIVTEPTDIRADTYGVFEADLVTQLPYRETILDLNIEVSAVMITEDNLILEQNGRRTYRILSI